jgi:outer membrane lipoprotein SlyB
MNHTANYQEHVSPHPTFLPSTTNTREVVGVFMTANDLQNAIRELEAIAFPRHSISIMGERSALEKTFGSKAVSPDIALNASNTPRQAPSRPEEQTIGAAGIIGGSAYIGAMGLALSAGAVAFPAIISAAVLGGISGGTVGALLTKIMGDRYERHIREQIEEGGLLLWVQTPDKDREDSARHIYIKNNAYNVHVQRYDD